MTRAADAIHFGQLLVGLRNDIEYRFPGTVFL
jgi:hypothetical protein